MSGRVTVRSTIIAETAVRAVRHILPDSVGVIVLVYDDANEGTCAVRSQGLSREAVQAVVKVMAEQLIEQPPALVERDGDDA